MVYGYGITEEKKKQKTKNGSWVGRQRRKKLTEQVEEVGGQRGGNVILTDF